MSLNVLLISDTIIKDRTSIHGNIDPKIIYPEIKVAQDMYIHPILGTALFNKLIELVESGSFVGFEEYETLLTDYIIDPLMYYVLSELCTTSSFQFWNKGVIRKQGDSTELPTMSELLDISNKYRMRAEWYGERLTAYLKETADESTLTEYITDSGGLDTITPSDSNYTMPVYLGHHYNCVSLDKNNCNCNCNGEEYQ